MNEISNKYFVFLISAGRTGTRFLGKQLNEMIQNAYSVHEPDVLTPRKGYQFSQKIRTFGLYHLVLGKLLGKTGIRNLSQRYVSGKISLKELQNAIIKQREQYYKTIPKELIIESYSGWYGCIPAIQNLFKNYKIIIITRNPEDWVTSNMNWGSLFGKRDWVSKLGLGRLNPKMINDEKYLKKWKQFSRFEKICWTYKTQYEIMINHIQNDPNAMVTKFEDLFYSENKYEHLNNLLSFITNFQGKQFDYKIPEGILNEKVHKNISYKFPNYDKWNNDKKRNYKDICGDIMKKLYYE